jgi:hypothetical protein
MTRNGYITPPRLSSIVLFIMVSSLMISNLFGRGLIHKTNPATRIDTIFVGNPLPNSNLIKTTHSRFSLLIHANNTYKSIKFLDREVTVKGNKILVVQKLYNGAYVNIDSVLVYSQTLMPIESHSDINTSVDSFTYDKNRVSGTLLAREVNKKGLIKIDTIFSKPLFNGLIYAETYQALFYKKNDPFYIAEYVPGHSTKFTQVEYIKDESVAISGLKIAAKLLKMDIGKTTIYCWLNAKNQELLKIEGKFPGFDYDMLRML